MDSMKMKVDVFRDVMIPMSDGVKLAADVYRPRSSARLPTIVTRTPYGKNGVFTKLFEFRRLAASGYAVVVQDKRGVHGSEGDYSLLRDDSAGRNPDGFDTVEWIAAQEWSDGRVIAYGLSYSAHTTMGAAVARPPHLTAAMSIQPATDEYTDRTFVDGVLYLQAVVDWAAAALVTPGLVTKPKPGGEDLTTELAAYKRDRAALYRTLPLEALPYLRHLPLVWGEMLHHREDPEFFAENRISADEVAGIEVPIVHIGGWFDFFTRNTVRHFELAQSMTATEQLLVVGPWTHGDFVTGKVNGVTLPDSQVDTNQLLLEWAGSHTGGQRVRPSKVAAYLYVLGVNRWRAEAQWPIPGTQVTPYFLAADGKLGTQPGDDGVRRFDYDPRTPYTAKSVTVGLPNVGAHHDPEKVLVYRSEVLDAPIEITGWPSAELRARTSATDVDWLVELNVVGADGTSRLLSEGVARARYRNGRTAPEAVVPGQEQTYRVELRPISVVIKPGERIEIAISGGKFPTYERNPGAFIDLNTFTADDFVVSRNEVLAGVSGSRVFLPIVPETAQGSWVTNPWPGTRRWRLTMGNLMRVFFRLIRA